jgi:catechol 2,3-dioxygenase-like lactoylglutathione lyase family enzyme
MIDHLMLTVRDVERSIDFYTRALAPLGYGVAMRFEKYVGFGTKQKPSFWISPGPTSLPRLHIAFRAEARADVDRFYQEALAAGGRDNGAPGLRADYHPHYYGAFVIDPEGHNIEAVCHTPAPSARGKLRRPRAAAERPLAKRRAAR